MTMKTPWPPRLMPARLADCCASSASSAPRRWWSPTWWGPASSPPPASWRATWAAPRLILLAWLAGALFALCGALSYSELGINFPSSGGEYVYLTRAFGPTWGFMTGWVSFFAGFSAPIAAAALAFANYSGYFFPAFKQANAQFTIRLRRVVVHLGGAQLLASALIAGFTILNCFGVGRTASVQNVLTGNEAGRHRLVSSLLGFLAGTGSWSIFRKPAVRTSTVSVPAQFIISLLWVMVGYSGWNAATYVAEELKQTRSARCPLALATGTALVTALYLGLNLIFIYSTPLESDERRAGHGVAGGFELVRRAGGGHLRRADGGVHHFHGERHGDHRPARLLRHGQEQGVLQSRGGRSTRSGTRRWRRSSRQGICAMLMTLTPFPQLVIYIGFSLTFFTVMSVASLFIFRRKPGWQKLRPVSFAFR